MDPQPGSIFLNLAKYVLLTECRTELRLAVEALPEDAIWTRVNAGGLLVGILMHASLTGSARIIGASGIAGLPLMTSDLPWFAAVWAAVATVTLANGGRLSR